MMLVWVSQTDSLEGIVLGGGVGNSPGEVDLPPPFGQLAVHLAFFVGLSFSAWLVYLWRSVRGCSWCLASGFL